MELNYIDWVTAFVNSVILLSLILTGAAIGAWFRDFTEKNKHNNKLMEDIQIIKDALEASKLKQEEQAIDIATILANVEKVAKETESSLKEIVRLNELLAAEKPDLTEIKALAQSVLATATANSEALGNVKTKVKEVDDQVVDATTPVDPTPVDPAPVDPAPVDPTPAQPAE